MRKGSQTVHNLLAEIRINHKSEIEEFSKKHPELFPSPKIKTKNQTINIGYKHRFGWG